MEGRQTGADGSSGRARDGRRFEPPVGGYQPSDERDLGRCPPKDDGCRAVRSMLRDYCDGDLVDAAKQHVDEHVHNCRDCALALSRMELEVLRLRQAFEAERSIAAEVPAGLTAGVMAQVGRVVLESDDAPPQFTNRVMDRVRREWPRSGRLRGVLGRGVFGRGVFGRGVFEGAIGRRRVRTLAAAVGILLVVAAVGVASWTQTEVAGEVRFEIVAAADATVERGAARSLDRRSLSVRPGLRLSAGDVIRADGLDQVVLDRVDPRQRDPNSPIPAAREARAVIDPGSACRIDADGRLSLLRGAVSVDADSPVEIGLPDGVGVSLQNSAAFVSVEAVRRHDDALSGRTTFRSRVEVDHGQARVVRGAAEAQLVAGGQVARFDTWSGIDIDAAPTMSLLARSARAGLRPAVASVDDPEVRTGPANWTGRVVDAATGRGVERAEVEVRVGSSELQAVNTDAEGFFEFSGGLDRAATAIIRVVPPRGPGTGWSSFGPSTVAVADGGSHRLASVALGPDAPVRGVVWTAAGGRVDAARVVPYVFDEIFEVADRLDSLAVASDPEGRFVLRGLPAELEQHQTLALVVEKAGLPRHAQILAGSAVTATAIGPIEVVVPVPQQIAVAGLQPNLEARFLREIPGVSLAVMTEEFRVRADANGTALIDGVGPGALWVVDQGGAVLHAVVAAAVGGPHLVAAAETRSARGFERLTSEPQAFLDGGISARGTAAALVAVGRRLDLAADPASPRSARYLSVGRAVAAGTRLFLETRDGGLVFLGEVDLSGVLAFAEPATRPFRLVAIGADGSVGISTGEQLDADRGVLSLAEPGEVDLGATHRGSLTAGALVAFEVAEGPLEGRRFWRVVDAEHGFSAGDLPPGSYRVTLPDGSGYRCDVRSGTRVGLGEAIPSPRAADTRGR